jgi:hypothetical protein
MGLSARAGVKRFSVVARKSSAGRKPAMALKPVVMPIVSDLNLCVGRNDSAGYLSSITYKNLIYIHSPRSAREDLT